MRFYLYSSQDLWIENGEQSFNVFKGAIFCVQLSDEECIKIYFKEACGVMILDNRTVLNRCHQQINFHNLNDATILCEIKPAMHADRCKYFNIKNAVVKLVENNGKVHLFHNDKLCGEIDNDFSAFVFETKSINNIEHGIVCCGKDKKHIIIFNENKIIFDSEYIDYEITSSEINIYIANRNMLNVETLIKLDCKTGEFNYKFIARHLGEKTLTSPEFLVAYFLDAIMCKRFKVAYSKLSHELKSAINIQVLEKYFAPFDQFVYVEEQEAYVTLKNNKVAGIYHFVVNDNFIDNIS